MKTYTFILDYKGGTYISQLNASDLQDALRNWVNTLDVKEIKYFGEKSKNELFDRVKNETPTPLKTMKNVWCLSLGISTGFMIVNIVQTELSE